MDTNSLFKRLHKYGQDLLFDKVHNKLKVVIEDDKNNSFLANGLLSKYQDKNFTVKDDTQSLNKTYIIFDIDELVKLKDMKTGTKHLEFNSIKTVILDGLRYNVDRFEINNHTRDFLTLEITKFKV